MRLTVGNIDAGVAVLLSQDHYVLEVPTFMLPPDVVPGVAVDLDFRSNTAADARKASAFAALVERAHAAIADTPPRAPELRLTSASSHSLSLAWFGGSNSRRKFAPSSGSVGIHSLPPRQQHLANSRTTPAVKRDIAFANNEPVFELLLDDKCMLRSCGLTTATLTTSSLKPVAVNYTDGSISDASADNLNGGAAVPSGIDGNVVGDGYDDDDDDDDDDNSSMSKSYSHLLEEGQHVFEGLESDTTYDVVARITTQDGLVIYSNRLRLRTLPDHMRMPLPTSPMFFAGHSADGGRPHHPLEMTLDAFSAQSLHEDLSVDMPDASASTETMEYVMKSSASSNYDLDIVLDKADAEPDARENLADGSYEHGDAVKTPDQGLQENLEEAEFDDIELIE